MKQIANKYVLTFRKEIYSLNNSKLYDENGMTLKLMPGTPIKINIPKTNNNVINWSDGYIWRDHVEIVINGQSLIFYTIIQWLYAADASEDFFTKGLDIVFDDEYLKVKSLFLKIRELTEELMKDHIGKRGLQALKLNITV